MSSKSLVPSLGSLLKTIESLSITTYMVRAVKIDKTRGLLTENRFRQRSMEKSVCDIELMNGPSLGYNQSQDGVNGSMLDNWT